MNSWELCISVQNNNLKFVVCKYDKKQNKILISKCFQLIIPEEFNIFDKNHLGAIVGLVRNELKKNGIKTKKYLMCFGDKSIITRVIKLPKMEVKDLESFMNQSISQYFSITDDDYCFDYRIQGVNEADEKAYYNLFLIALPKYILETYSNIFLKCGLRPKNISMYADVFANLFSNFVNNFITIINIGYTQTEVMVLERNYIFINSVVDFRLPRSGLNKGEDVYLANLTQEDLGEDFLIVLENIENYINFFSSRHHGESIQDIYFIGEGAKLKKVIDSLRENMNINIVSGEELFKEDIIPYKMSSIETFEPEIYYSCLGLLLGGRKK